MKKFLIDEFDKEKGKKLYKAQQERFNILLKQTRYKSKNQLKTLKKYILPRIALYQVLQESAIEKERALQIVSKNILEVAQKTKNLIHILEKMPCFYLIFRKLFSMGLKADNWELKMEKNDKEAMVFTIKKCLWHETCLQHHCPELCPMFCKSDDLTYGSMKNITFIRTQTLGMGGDCCDFKFVHNK